MVSFQELLILFSFSIFVVTLFLIFKFRKSFEEHRIERLPMLHSSIFSKVLHRVHYSLILLFVIVTGYSIWFGSRPFIYFAVLGLLFVSSVLLVLFDSPERTGSVSRVIFLTLAIVSLIQCMAPILENRLMVFGPDQWTFVDGAKSVFEQGAIANSASTYPYYSLIPFLNLLIASLTIVTGNIFLSSAILTAAMSLVMVFSIYLILLKLTKRHVASVIGVFAFLSIPHLSLVQAIPSTLSLVLATLFVLMLIDVVSFPSRRLLVAMLLAAFSALVCHPAGIIAITALCTGIVVLCFLGVFRDMYLESKLVRALLISTCVLSLLYWSLSDVVFTQVILPLKTLLTSIPYSFGLSVYNPNYFGGGFQIFSYVWALPVGVSAAYVTFLLFNRLKGKIGRGDRKNTLNMFAFAAGAMGLLSIIVAFISIIHAPSGSVERYLDAPAYFLLVVPTATVCYQLIETKQKIVVVSLMILLVPFIVIGPSSPDWAPFENSRFSAVYYTYTGYREAETIVRFLPNNSFIVCDHDIAVDGLASFYNIPFSIYGTFQITRNVLNSIKDGTFNASSQLEPNATYTVKLDEIQNRTAIDKYFNKVYDNGMHIVLAVRAQS